MSFDFYVFWEICIFIIPIVMVFSLLFSAILGSVAQHSSSGMQVMIFLSYLFALGVITHELAHRLFCALFGVKVTETKFFRVARNKTAEGEYVSVGGYVNCAEIDSVSVALLLGFAPLLINGLLVAVLYYYGPVLATTDFYGIAIYLGISLALGTRVSKEDALLWVEALRRHPGRGILEIVGLFLFGGVLYFLVGFIQIPLWGTLSILLGFLIIIILGTRFKSTSKNRVRLPGM